jgi:hypothetical protein
MNSLTFCPSTDRALLSKHKRPSLSAVFSIHRSMGFEKTEILKSQFSNDDGSLVPKLIAKNKLYRARYIII